MDALMLALAWVLHEVQILRLDHSSAYLSLIPKTRVIGDPINALSFLLPFVLLSFTASGMESSSRLRKKRKLGTWKRSTTARIPQNGS